MVEGNFKQCFASLLIAYFLVLLPSSSGMQAAFLTIEQVRDIDLGHGDKPDYFNCKSIVTFTKKDNCLYKVRIRT